MATSELHDILFAMIATMDQIFEFWMTASFAVVVATHFLTGQMTRVTAALVAVAYSLMSAFLSVRLAIVGTKMYETLARLADAGEMFPMSLLSVARLLLISTAIFGFFAVLFFLWHSSKADPTD